MSKTAHSTLNLRNHSRNLHPTPSNKRVRNAKPSLFMATIQPSQHRGAALLARSDALRHAKAEETLRARAGGNGVHH